MAAWVTALDWRLGGPGLESRCGNLIRFGTLAIPFTPLCQCFSEETLKAAGPFYLVSMPREVKDPTSLHRKCVTCRGLHHPLLGRVHTCSGSRSGPVPLVRVAFTPAKIDQTRSGCGPVTRSHLFRNATGTRTLSTPSSHQVFRSDVKVIIDGDGLVSMARYDEA